MCVHGTPKNEKEMFHFVLRQPVI